MVQTELLGTLPTEQKVTIVIKPKPPPTESLVLECTCKSAIDTSLLRTNGFCVEYCLVSSAAQCVVLLNVVDMRPREQGLDRAAVLAEDLGFVMAARVVLHMR
ncbi:hypothetical protein J7T55_002454 [Diaporthe amygdali]|uniref:uncharacterized protein n=1 Tax=Phomopsis amygdali TaxID=1214568 RepID=UPI0022FEAA60|nr:uncharacterized protein J7T55_002454 [Diaporthe amygdali]KAJ0121943.1 hypothetical protein J7T55_002454 [Diaporthe amygdali]